MFTAKDIYVMAASLIGGSEHLTPQEALDVIFGGVE